MNHVTFRAAANNALLTFIVLLYDEGYFPPSEAEKNRFFFYLKKLNTNIKPNIIIKKKYLKSLKAPDLFRTTHFQIKGKISGRCHNL